MVQPTYFAVRRVHGRAWDAALPMRAQALWPEHSEFMTALTAEKFVVLGGPLGSRAEVLLVIDAPTQDAVRARLAKDPWSMAHILEIASIEPWTIMLDGRRH
ncbi:MAG: YciI family protein [Steroidobacteraceae bacterium]